MYKVLFFCAVSASAAFGSVAMSGLAMAQEDCQAVSYAPVYPVLYAGKAEGTISMAVTLAVHNVSLEDPITIQEVTYHDMVGDTVATPVDAEAILAPLETREIKIDLPDLKKEIGSGFVVKWSSEKASLPPIVETVMVGSKDSRGYVFSTQGRMISDSCGRMPPR